jgi:LysM repeat protein
LGLIAPLVSLIVAASAQRTITYTVQPGDSLYTIAHKHGLRLPDLLKVNNLRNPHALQVGDQIKIPVKEQRSSVGAAHGSTRRPRIGLGGTQYRSGQHSNRAINGRQAHHPRRSLDEGAGAGASRRLEPHSASERRGWLGACQVPQPDQAPANTKASSEADLQHRKPAPRTAQRVGVAHERRPSQQPTASKTCPANGGRLERLPMVSRPWFVVR